VKDLVGVRVADAGEQGRVGEGTLERVALAPKRGAEAGKVRLEHLQAAAVKGHKRSGAAHNVQRRAPLCSGLGQQKRPRREIKALKAHFPRHISLRLAPVQPPGDHEVDHQVKLTLERDHDPLAEPAYVPSEPSFRLRERRRHGAQKEGTRETNTFQPCAADPRGQVLDVHDHVRKLGHAGRIIAPVGQPPGTVRW
jgi:hypothetical protein